MIDRAYLKQKGMAAFKNNYWPCVGVALILTWTAGTNSLNLSNNYTKRLNNTQNTYNYDLDDFDYDSDDYDEYDYDYDFDDLDDLDDLTDDHGDNGITDQMVYGMLGAMAPIIIGIALVAMAFGIALSVFVKNPLRVGCRRYFCINSFEKPKFGEVGYAFKKGQYGNIVKVLFMKDLFVFLWSLLLIIPGLIKSYEYYMVDYILSEDPNIGYKEALEQSKRMMDGYKMDTFILELSFIGWALLAALTCGILSIFYVSPYMYATYAEFFLDRRSGYFGPNVSPYHIPSFAGMGGFGGAGGYGGGAGGYGGSAGGYGGAGGLAGGAGGNYGGQPYNPSDPYGQPGAPSDPYGGPDPYGTPSSYAPSEPYVPPTSNPGNSTNTYSLASKPAEDDGNATPGSATPSGALPSGDYYNPDSTVTPNNDDTPFGI
ncbi:Protein of unknown function [Lachnospiraceae bacterium NE2001]|nr:Protein of unknown function [Lachnospiraceae bacterium NE2001]SEQ99123.1 Protein of unknown function [Lachnospiraceae bacterium NE2001]